MAFGEGNFVKIWKVVDRGNYSEVSISSNKKNKQTGEYETDFSCNFVRFCGKAHNQRPMEGQKIKLTSCSVTNCYEKDKQRVYTKNPTYCVFGYELQDSAPAAERIQPNWEELGAQDIDLPF